MVELFVIFVSLICRALHEMVEMDGKWLLSRTSASVPIPLDLHLHVCLIDMPHSSVSVLKGVYDGERKKVEMSSGQEGEKMIEELPPLRK